MDVRDTYNAFTGGSGWDKLFAVAAWVPGLDLMKGAKKVFKSFKAIDASDVNNIFKRNGYNAPYDEAFGVIEGVLKNDEKFVRVHGPKNKESKWMMKESEIAGLSPSEIQNKFALPETPTHLSDVNVPAGTKVRTGVAGRVVDDTGKVWGNGGGQQVEVLNKLPSSSFSNTRKLD